MYEFALLRERNKNERERERKVGKRNQNWKQIKIRKLAENEERHANIVARNVTAQMLQDY